MSEARSIITDKHGRSFDYLRVAVTERCNLRCIYCMPEEGVDFASGERLLSTTNLLKIIRVAAKLGVRKVRFTGGEPLIRKDLLEIISQTKATPGIESVHITSNGVLFKESAVALKAAGLNGVNISLDTLKAERFRAITRRGGLAAVLSSIDAASELGFDSVKINVVALRGFNEDEIPDFVRLTKDRPILVRFIELMPFDARQVWKKGKFFGVDRIREVLEAAYPELAPSSGSATEQFVYALPGHHGKVALIPAFGRSMCGTCNRIRLTADGKLRNCLYSEREFDLLPIVRGGGGEDAIAQAIREAMSHKMVDGWAAQKEERPISARHRRSMTQIGG